jgi:ABC-type glycerol-3-phosphate transport system permease component
MGRQRPINGWSDDATHLISLIGTPFGRDERHYRLLTVRLTGSGLLHKIHPPGTRACACWRERRFASRGKTVPKEIADLARVDGAGSVRILLEIMLPLIRNGIVVVIIVNFVTAWGEYLLAATLMHDQSSRTLPVVLASASGGMGAWAWPRIAAVYVMAILPALVALAGAQRWYMRGL